MSLVLSSVIFQFETIIDSAPDIKKAEGRSKRGFSYSSELHEVWHAESKTISAFISKSKAT